jgi:hypothetical protein
MGRACSTNGGKRGMHIGYWWEKPEGKRRLGRPSCRWLDNITMDFIEI